MARPKNISGEGHHGILATVEKQYLAALKFSRDQIDRRIAALEGTMGGGGASGGAKKTVSSSHNSYSSHNASTPAIKTKSSEHTRKPRNYDMLKSKLTQPMTMVEMLKTLGMKEKQEGTLRQTMQNYKGLFKSDGKRPATYTFDSSR